MRRQINYIFLILLLWVFHACQPPMSDSKADSWTDRSANQHASNFKINRLDSCWLVTIDRTHKSATKPIRYLLHKTGATFPNITYDHAIEIPLKRVAVTNTVDMAFMVKLGLVDQMVAVSDTGYIYNATIKGKVHQGDIKQIQQQQILDYETLIDLSPDAIFMQRIDDGSISEKLKELGIPIIYTADYLENSLLGRAEWIKFMSVFFDAERQADRIFTQIESDYNQQMQMLKDRRDEKPKVLTGAVYEGVWYVAGGQSLTAKVIKDAGGDYIWSENKETGGVPYSFEKVFSEGKEADIWINVSNYRHKDRMLNENSRYALFKPFNEAVMYNYYKRMTSSGGSDVFESAIVEPNLLLKDYINMFNGQDSLLRYYELITP